MPGLSLIVNPAAGGGRARRIVRHVTGALSAARADFDAAESESLEHAVLMAEAAAVSGRVVVAVGGDGTASALSGIAARHGAVCGIVPAGRGNDLARMLRIPTDPVAAARVLAAGTARRIDLIGVSLAGQPEVIVAGTVYAGLPSVAGQIANAARWPRGPAVYHLAALRALARWAPVRFDLRGPAGPRSVTGYAVVVANSAYFGAGMRVAPLARIDDGQLDLVLMRHAPKATFVRALRKISGGSHAMLAEVSMERHAEVVLTLDRALPVAADGEVLPCACPLPAGTPLRIRALPGALTIIAPPPASDAPAGAG